jgi:flagellar hook-associated protein 1
MTIPGYMGLEIALSGLQASQAAIDTTSNNIANANTPGYSRETADLVERSPLTIPAISSVTGAGVNLGTGVTVNTIERIRDQFLDVQYRTQNAATSNANEQSTILNQVQSALNEPSNSGLSSRLSAFWSAWNDLANNPTSTAAQQSVLDAGTTLAEGYNQLSSQLTTIENQVDSQWSTLTNQANGQVANDAQQIASLNGQIAQATAAGESSAALEDKRDNLLDNLSGYASVYVTTDPTTNMVTVSIGNAATAAAGGTADNTPLVSGKTTDLTDNLTEANLNATSGGELGALKTLYDSTGNTGTIPGYIGKLNTAAQQLADSANKIYTNNAATATNFFTYNAVTGAAGTIAVNGTLTAGNVMTSSGATDPSSGALPTQIAELSGGQPDQDYGGLVSQIGSDTRAMQNTQQTQQSLLTAISNQRQGVSGVSLDEEMTNLIEFQRSYQACARVMSTMDSALNTLINNTGLG